MADFNQRYRDWERRRCELTDMEDGLTGQPRPGEWHDSDDDAVALLREAITVMSNADRIIAEQHRKLSSSLAANAELRSTIAAHRDQMAHMISSDALARMMTRCADSAGEWGGADVCQELSLLIEAAHGWSADECDADHRWPATITDCPFCSPEDDDEEDYE